MRNDTDDLISKQVVINTVRTIILGFFSDEDGVMTDTEKTLLSVNKAICDGVRALPSAQQDCTDCPEYDHKTHSCPKYCEVIRKTVEEAKQERTGRWIDYVEDGYVECPFCHSATNCDGNISELHFCFSCGARMEGKS